MSPLEIESISPVVFPNLLAAVVGIVVGLVMCIGVIADMGVVVCARVLVGSVSVGVSSQRKWSTSISLNKIYISFASWQHAKYFTCGYTINRIKILQGSA